MHPEGALLWQESDSEDGCIAVAEKLMQSCPTLRRVAFPSKGQRALGCYSYVRSVNGEVVFEGRGSHLSDSWQRYYAEQMQV